MGHKYKVYAWVLNPESKSKDDKYYYKLKYQGNDMLEAFAMIFALKKAGINCVKFEWCG